MKENFEKKIYLQVVDQFGIPFVVELLKVAYLIDERFHLKEQLTTIIQYINVNKRKDRIEILHEFNQYKVNCNKQNNSTYQWSKYVFLKTDYFDNKYEKECLEYISNKLNKYKNL